MHSSAPPMPTGILSTSDMFEISGKLTPALSLVYGLPIAILLYHLFRPSNLRHIPTEGGSSFPLLSYIGAYNFFNNAVEILQKGYDEHKDKVFKVALPDRWLVAINGPKLVDEVQKMPDTKMSFQEAVGDVVGFRHIFGPDVQSDPFHIGVVRDKLTRNLVSLFGGVYDEIDTAFKELIPANEKKWVPVPAMEVMRIIVARASGRIFVGLPLCRNKEYLDLSINFTKDIGKARQVIIWVPMFLRRLVAMMTTDIENRIAKCRKFIEPAVLERMALMDQLGEEWHDKPNDLLQWIIEETKVRNQGPYEVARMILLLNFAAIHTSSHSFTHALFHLAAMPEYIGILRAEIEATIAEEGWTKAAMGKMWKLDSFMRESQRLNGIATTSITRKAMQSVTLSDGTYIPKDTILVTPALATHCDEGNYRDPLVFDPFRYSRQKEQDNSAVKHQFVTTSADYVAFGHGKHACPGRFFAANELKAMMAYLVLNYDVKLEHDSDVRPENLYAGMTVSPNPTAKVLFKKRVV